LKLSIEYKIGLIVTLSLVLLYWGVNFLKGKDVLSNERIFVAVYNDVGGLEKTNPITINGLKVGQVRDMYFVGTGNARVVIELVLKNEIPIPVNSTAKIVSSDLLGSKAVEITLGNSPELAAPGDTLIASVEASIKDEVNRQLKPLKTKAEDLMGSIDTVLTMLQGVFSTDNTANFSKSVESIASSFENLESTTSTLDTLMTGQKNRIEQILENIESITANLKNNENQLNNIIANFSAVSDSIAGIRFAQTMSHVDQTVKELANITGKINRGEGSMGMLINNDSLYIELEKSSRELNLLLEDIRLNPKKYVRFSVF
jgi:phospholipid/cholesterol/gamma-HCH transport system substrate-binding protein